MRLALAVLLLLTLGAGLRSPKDAGDASRLNKPMVKQVLPPLPPGYSPTTVAAAPAPALAVTVLAVPGAPYDILPPLITASNICFPVLSQFTNAVILCSTDLVHWSPLTNFCGMSERMYFKLKH